MPNPVHFKLLSYNDTGLKNAVHILNRNMRGSLMGLGGKLRASAHRIMREDTGAGKRNLTIEVRGGGLNLSMSMYGTLVQLFVDAYGREPGKFPPFRKGSKLYRWTERKIKGFESAKVIRGKAKRTISHLTRRPRQRTKVVKAKSGPLTTKQRLTARERSIEKVSFLMARHIYEHGIKPSHWNQKTLERNKAMILQDLADALKRSVQEINRGGQ